MATISNSKRGKFGHIRSLDGVRGIAVLSVLVHHTIGTGLPVGPWPLYDRFAISVASYGYLGVDLFFVLSGFLITTLLLIARRKPQYFSNFYWKRVFRILPPFLLIIGVLRVAHMMSNAYVLLSLLFIANFNTLFHINADGPFWSLAIEEQFYLVWPLLVRKLTVRHLRQVLFAVIVAEPLLRILMTYGGHSIAYYTFTRCDGLAWGALLATEFRLRRLQYRTAEARQWWRSRGVPLWFIGVFLFTVGIMLGQFAHTARWATADLLTACPVFFSSSMAFLLIHRESLITRFISNPILRFYGDISYAFYLVHAYMAVPYERYFGPIAPGSSAQLYGRMFFVLATSTIICAVSLYAFERPVMRLRKLFITG